MFRGSLWLCAPNTAPGAPSPVERGQADALAAPAVEHNSASPLDASRRGEITRRASASDAAVPRLCDPPGAERSPWGSPRCPHNPPCLPLPSSPSRSSSEERKGPGPALRHGCPGERGGHRRRLPGGRAGSAAAPPPLPRPAPLGWKRCREISLASGSPPGKEGETASPSSPGAYPCLCPVHIIFRPDREYLVMGKTARGKEGEAGALSLAWFGMLIVTQALGKGRPLHPLLPWSRQLVAGAFQDPWVKSSFTVEERGDKLPRVERGQHDSDLEQISTARGGSKDIFQTAYFHL